MPFADAFTDVDMQAGVLVSSNDSFFKKAAYKRFPGGQFSCVAASTRDDESLNLWGQLWLSPAFAIDDLIKYYTSFGCVVKAQALNIQRG